MVRSKKRKNDEEMGFSLCTCLSTSYHLTTIITLYVCILLIERPVQVSSIKSLAYSFIPTAQEIITLKTKTNLEDWCRNQCMKSPSLLPYSLRVDKLLLPTSNANYIYTNAPPVHHECICMVDKANKLRQTAKRMLFGGHNELSSPIYECNILENNGNALKNALALDKARRAAGTVSEVCKLLKRPTLLTAVNLYAMMQNLVQLQMNVQNLDKKLYPDIFDIIDKAKTMEVSQEHRIKHIDTLNLIAESVGNIIIYKQAKDILANAQIKKLLWLAPYWYAKMEAFTWPVKIPDYERCKWFDSDTYRTDVVFAARQEAKSNIINRFIFLFNQHIEQKCSKLSDPTMNPVYRGPKSFAPVDFVKISSMILRNPDAYVDVKPKPLTKRRS